MKLTPLDIHHKEFRHSLRGYAEDEVDQFLDEVADEFERLFKENIDLSEKLENANAAVREFQLKESAVNNAIIAAQSAAEDMRNRAKSEADTIVRDAEIKAKEIIHNALAKKQAVAGELVRIKQAEEDFRSRFKALLDQHQRSVSEVALPGDVEVLLGETDDGVIADVIVSEPLSALDQVVESAAEQPAIPVADVPVGPAAAVAQASAPVEPAQATRPIARVEPLESRASGVVQSVALGEVGAPVIPDDIELVDPAEFKLPTMEILRERDDDLDIEEID